MSNDTDRSPQHPLNDTVPEGVDLVERAGMATGRTGLVKDGAELNLTLVLAPDAWGPDYQDRVLWAVVTGVYEAGRIIGILQAQADAAGCRPGLDAAAEHGHRWATEQITGGAS